MTPTDSHSRPGYHLQARLVPRRRRWRALAVLVLATVLFLTSAVLLVVPLVLLAVAVPALEAPLDQALTATDVSDPLTMALMLAMIALMLPATLLAVRLLGGRPIGTLSSVDGHLRGRLLVRCLRLAVLLTVPAVLVSAALDRRWTHAAVDGSTLPLLALALLVVPLQAAAEEYVFRGLLMQTIGAWARHPAWAIVLPVPLFAVGHDYGTLGTIDVAAFGLVAGWLTWRTGGLEAAIGLHVAVNGVLFALGSIGLVELDATEGTTAGLICSLSLMGVYAWVVRSWADTPSAETPPGVTYGSSVDQPWERLSAR
ncbi:CPBP family intramembrane glutamic endopeptidase [Nocardioides lijunqiniae]|uniref:CPBP family intramembrane glutamic endopeptidase n=1 Tax=Nocardioides lijunqiniae TaxID=2760832 RepID=UPI001878A3BB|nr:type II CAAX endopeptidase family protein [Nocardioides lijunqiniae]